ncbi:MAG: SurA N-terminal domain-containing protein [Bdellovibrionales bacterium]|nr:SurA N-terminal domain-containing protein [Bdellovibrionales bacterium]
MLKLIHRFQKTIVVYIVIFILCASMLIFGVDAMGPSQNAYAIKVGDKEISFDEFNEQRRAVEQRYVQQLGNNAGQVAKLIDAGMIKPTEEALERVVPAALVEIESIGDGFVASPEEVRAELSRNFNPETYRSFLQATGQSARAFEQSLGESLRSAQFARFLGDMAYPSKAEVAEYVKERDTTRDIAYVSFNVSDFVKDVAEITKEQQEEYFADHSEAFEIPDMVMYQYTAIAPQNVEDQVEVLDDDIELYYSEKEKNYTIPAKVKIQQILVSTTNEMSQEEKDKKKALAEEALGKALAGEDFAGLVTQYSDDISTNMIGGDMGWVSKGELNEAVEKAAFELEGPGIASLAESKEGFHVLKVEEYQSERLKPLDEVRAEIESIIRKREAPAYAAIVAQDLFEQWQDSGKALPEFLQGKPYSIKKTELVEKKSDPSPTLSGLTGYVLQAPDEKQQLVERGDSVVLVEVLEYKERDIPAMDAVAEKIIEQVKTEKARELAKQKAEDFRTQAVELGFQKASESLKVKAETAKDLKVNAALPAKLQDKAAQEFFKNTWKAENAVSAVIAKDDSFSVMSVSAIHIPEATEEAQGEAFAQLQTELESELSQAFINQRKTEVEVEISPGLLTQ